MAFSLWIIDVRNVIAEVRLTLLSNSNDTLDNLYTAALLDILRLSSVEDVLYAYMVCAFSSHHPSYVERSFRPTSVTLSSSGVCTHFGLARKKGLYF